MGEGGKRVAGTVGESWGFFEMLLWEIVGSNPSGAILVFSFFPQIENGDRVTVSFYKSIKPHSSLIQAR